MKRWFLAIFFIILLAACQTAPTAEIAPTDGSAPEAPVDGGEVTAYPAPGFAVPVPTTYPMTEVPTVSITPTTAPGTGQVTGTIKLNDKPVVDKTLYLATFLQNEEGVDYTAVVDVAVSPKTFTDTDGNFAFVNIAPGQYSLVLDIVTSQFLLLKPGTQEHFTIDVTADGTVDMGVLNYDELPIPQQ